MPLRLKKLQDILNPQPETAAVLGGLLDWIARADAAAQRGDAKPPRTLEDGQALFPESEWWLTDLERRQPRETALPTDREEAKLDEADLTLIPELAGAEDSSSDTDSGGEDSEGSLPGGPTPTRGPCSTGGPAATGGPTAT